MYFGNNKNRYLFFLLLFFIFFPIFCLAETRCYCYESSSDPDGGAGRYFSINCPDENCDEGDCRYYQCAPDTVPITEIRDYQAQTQSDKLKKQIEITTPVLQVDIGDTSIQFDPVKCSAGTDCEIPWLAQYIKVIFQYLVGLAAIISAAVVLFGGFIWLTSFGSPEKVKQAKDYIVGAFVGLFLALFSYLILFTINPDLVNLKPITIRVVSPLLAKVGAQKLGAPKPAANGAVPSTSGQCSQPRSAGESLPAQITSYCYPNRNDYSSDDEFLCDLAMQCTCPAGRDSSKTCNPGGRSWHPCNTFDWNNTPYCNQTASGQAPRSDLVAADPSCYPMGTQICIEGKTYSVGDTGGWIKGDHFDLWNANCSEAREVNRTVQVTVGSCQ